MTDQELLMLHERSDFHLLDERDLDRYLRLLRVNEKDLLSRITKAEQ